MQKRFLLKAAAAATLAAGFALPAAAQWKPTKPINLVVPWAAGGSTDQVTRVTAAELEKALGQKVVIVNQPGASGSIGTKTAWDAPKDGYTWAAGAAQDLGAYQTLGMLDVPAKDWHLFLSVANVPVVGVNAATPYQTMPQLLDAMKAKPGEIKVATAGVTSGGPNGMELISRAADVKYRHVTYDGGNPAAVATVAGETDLTTQLAVEQADFIRGKRIRPLAAVSDRPLELEGFGVIEPITKFVPNLKVPTNYFGIFIPKGVPPEVVAT
ncbi:MAG TPA: tripartite tricarboxylate transporter substrate binding protein, partial [Ramlibacter sp.]|nr:tripartite tricarboxylate transporter substrate binding protein [Ramlibacter sp.]